MKPQKKEEKNKWNRANKKSWKNKNGMDFYSVALRTAWVRNFSSWLPKYNLHVLVD